MKLTLDQLKVDSYAAQVSEIELTLVKGGDGEDGTPLLLIPLFVIVIGGTGCVQNNNQSSTSGNNTSNPTMAPSTKLDSISVSPTFGMPTGVPKT